MAALTDINGVGPSRAMRLANAGYGSIEAVADASVDELRAIVGVSIAAAEAMILGARDLAPDGAQTNADAPADDAGDGSDSTGEDDGDIIDRIAAQIVGGRKQRKRIVRDVSREIAARLAKPLRKELGVKRLTTTQVRHALAAVVAKELGK
jgi:hypothetical protein